MRNIRGKLAGLVVLALLCAAPAFGATPVLTPEKWLPDDTLGFVTVSKPREWRAMLERTLQGRLWQDPALRTFREKLDESWQRDFLKPLERDLDLEFRTYAEMITGSLTLAVIQGNTSGSEDSGPGWLLVADTEQEARLTKELGELRKRWFGAGKQVRSVTIREHEFVVLGFDTNSPLASLRRYLPRAFEIQELGTRPPPSHPPVKELLVGQSGSRLMVSTSARSLEKVLLRMAGGAAPVLGEQAAYDQCHKRLFTAAPMYGWLNAPACLALYAPPTIRETSEPPPPSPVDVLDKAKMVGASGLKSLRAVGFAASETSEGFGLEMFFSAPEAERQGVLKIAAGEAKPCDIPPFIPADVSEFQRWRVDGPRSWAIMEKMMGEISPQWLSAVNFIIDTANQAAQFKDPGFEVRKNLVANLGDDFITYSRLPKPGAETNPESASILLIASPNPGQLAAALQRILIFMTADAESPAQREFLGRTIYSVSLPAVPLPMGERGGGPGRFLHYSATSSYVALSTDTVLLEEHLRSAESNAASLKDLAGLKEAAQKVVGPGTSMFAYKSQAVLERYELEKIRSTSGSATNGVPTSTFLSWAGFLAPEKGLQEWMDYTALPPFERVAKYFHFSVRGTSASSDGLSISWFYPIPPVLRAEAAR